MATARLHRTTSADGTRIVGQVHGQGPPLVLVPGGPSDGDTGWDRLLPELTDRFTCFAVNTRGRGSSDDHPDHSRERIVEDVAAFVESVGDAVALFGHSAGGAHALEAAASTSAVRALALYEPTLTEFADAELTETFAAAFDRVQAAVADGRPADGARTFLEELALATEDELAAVDRAGATEHMAPLVPVVVEERSRSGLPQLSDLRTLDRVTMPVLILHGSRTHRFYVEVADQLAERLADVTVTEVPGLGHLGPEIDPAPVAAELTRFLQPAPTPSAP